MSDARQLDAEPDEDAADNDNEEPSRDRDLLGRKNSKCRQRLDKLFSKIIKGFEDQARRSDDLDKWWNIYHCVLDDNQFYNGNASVYIPILYDATEARVTRFSNQAFPNGGRYIDCTTTDGHEPYEITALIEYYIRSARFKTQVVQPLLVCGDVEGQYNLYVDWQEIERQVVSRETRKALIPFEGGHVEAEDEDIEDIVEEDVVDGMPGFEVLHDSDVLLLPATANGAEDAVRRGCAVIVRRWSEDKIDEMVDAGEIDKAEAEDLKASMMSGNGVGSPGLPNIVKDIIKTLGIRGEGKHAIVFEVWTTLPLDDKGQFSEKGKRRIVRAWMGGGRQLLGCRRNPYWSDRVPLWSEPVKKIAGAAKGKSLYEPLAPIQWEANDAANERADGDHFSSQPIVMRKPGEYNRPLIFNLAAVWDVDPNDVKFAEFPDLSQRARARIQDAIMLIERSLGVNPSMIPSTGVPGRKRNQAEIAMEQQVDLLTTDRAVSRLVEAILDPVVAFIIDCDHQFREEEITIRAYGEMGIMAEMIPVGPLQNRHAYQFEWCGAEQARLNVAMQQQGTALLNVARGMQQQLQSEGYELRIGPALEKAFLNTFGPKTARLMLVDLRRQMSMDPEQENIALENGMQVVVHKMDVDEAHIPVHQQAMQETGDPLGLIKMHVQMHVQQMNAKRQAQQTQQMAMMAKMMNQAGGAPGVPGGRGPGVAGTPRMGAQPGQPRMQRPAGMIHADRLPRAAGGSVVQMPRKM